MVTLRYQNCLYNCIADVLSLANTFLLDLEWNIDCLFAYVQGARNEIFSMQPAPIQVSYMGFPGTTGANYIHYLVTDEVLYIHTYMCHKLFLCSNLIYVFPYHPSAIWVPHRSLDVSLTRTPLFIAVCFTYVLLKYIF